MRARDLKKWLTKEEQVWFDFGCLDIWKPLKEGGYDCTTAEVRPVLEALAEARISLARVDAARDGYCALCGAGFSVPHRAHCVLATMPRPK